jgi:transposase
MKGQSGVLKDMDSRAAFLQDASHRIRLVYTPKHCSWLNQVEIKSREHWTKRTARGKV